MQLEYKLLTPELKMTDEGSGAIAGYASTFANWDDVKERPIPGAFNPHLSAFLKDGFIAIGHNWGALPIATPKEAYEDEHGLFLRADFHSTLTAQDARTVVTERLSRGKSVKLSIGYEVLDDEYTQDGRLLKDIKLYEVSLVTVPANPLASVTGAKTLMLEGGPLSAYKDAVEATFNALILEVRRLEDRREKAGRVISEANLKVVDDAIETGSRLVEILKDLRGRAEPQKQNGHAETNAIRIRWIEQQQRLRELGVYP